MNKIKTIFAIIVIFLAIGFTSKSHSQSSPVLYFCESYGSNGEVSISDRFYTGYLTIMVKADTPLGLTDVSIQFDKYNCSTGTFGFYKKFTYVIKPDMKYIYFEKNDQSDLNFEKAGIYRVFLLNSTGGTVASGLIEIINR